MSLKNECKPKIKQLVYAFGKTLNECILLVGLICSNYNILLDTKSLYRSILLLLLVQKK